MKSDELFALLKRRGFLWPTAEVYGGAQGLYDYGPLGASLKRRIEEVWSSWFVGLSEDFYLIDAAELLPEAVVRASGHLENFTDAEVACGKCHSAFRAETLLEAARPQGVDGLSSSEIANLVRSTGVRCPTCGSQELTVPQPFNLMFGVDFGVMGRERVYLRPETAQSSYLAFSRMWDVGRRALPLGIAVIGKAFRNEIAPRQVLFRMRSFTQAELQIFFDPESFAVPMHRVMDETLPVLSAERRAAGERDAESVRAADLATAGVVPEFFVFHLAHTYRFLRDVLGYPANRIRLYEKSSQERAFYNRIQYDVEVQQESLGGFRELGAVHYRGDYDLTRHSAGSGKDLSVVLGPDRRLLPHVLEITFGVDRLLWALADLGLTTKNERTVWSLRPYLAPVAVGVFPLLVREHARVAQEVTQRLRAAGITARYDGSGSIGRRYARGDEAGVPFAVTVDGETVDASNPQHDTVTLRERDTRAQERVAIAALVERLRPSLAVPWPVPY